MCPLSRLRGATPPRPTVIDAVRIRPLHLRAPPASICSKNDALWGRAAPRVAIVRSRRPRSRISPEQPEQGDEGCNDDVFNKVATRRRHHRPRRPKSGSVFTSNHASPNPQVASCHQPRGRCHHHGPCAQRRGPSYKPDSYPPTTVRGPSKQIPTTHIIGTIVLRSTLGSDRVRENRMGWCQQGDLAPPVVWRRTQGGRHPTIAPW
jgi:hypothetical protein